MGFMDKLKNAGKSVVKGALIMSATSYGMVSSGKHKLCKVCMNSTFDKLTFVKVAAIEGEYVIKDAIKTFWLDSEKDSECYHHIKIRFNDGEESVVMLTVDKNQGSALPSAAERLAAQYKDAAKLVAALAKHAPEVSEETKQWANKIMRYAGSNERF